MTDKESTSCRIDVLAIGLFGLAVGALTIGMAQIGQIPEMDRARVLVIALVFGGLIQVLAGDCLSSIQRTAWRDGTHNVWLYWITVSIAQLISMRTTFHFDSPLFVPIDLVYVCFSAVMVYLTAYRPVVLSFLHAITSPKRFSPSFT
jgi:uncharacterized protein